MDSNTEANENAGELPDPKTCAGDDVNRSDVKNYGNELESDPSLQTVTVNESAGGNEAVNEGHEQGDRDQGVSEAQKKSVSLALVPISVPTSAANDPLYFRSPNIFNEVKTDYAVKWQEPTTSALQLVFNKGRHGPRRNLAAEFMKYRPVGFNGNDQNQANDSVFSRSAESGLANVPPANQDNWRFPRAGPLLPFTGYPRATSVSYVSEKTRNIYYGNLRVDTGLPFMPSLSYTPLAGGPPYTLTGEGSKPASRLSATPNDGNLQVAVRMPTFLASAEPGLVGNSYCTTPWFETPGLDSNFNMTAVKMINLLEGRLPENADCAPDGAADEFSPLPGSSLTPLTNIPLKAPQSACADIVDPKMESVEHLIETQHNTTFSNISNRKRAPSPFAGRSDTTTSSSVITISSDSLASDECPPKGDFGPSQTSFAIHRVAHYPLCQRDLAPTLNSSNVISSTVTEGPMMETLSTDKGIAAKKRCLEDDLKWAYFFPTGVASRTRNAEKRRIQIIMEKSGRVPTRDVREPAVKDCREDDQMGSKKKEKSESYWKRNETALKTTKKGNRRGRARNGSYQRNAKRSSEDKVTIYREGKDKKLYCVCRKVLMAYGNMVACSAKGCERKWFHYGCVGFVADPPPGEL
ncbi:unnamed protein product [Haemonchus placei]|uniref:PHD-type domain-containing protein n=1 Tax=Haemonchus placei TaxID=6290 RepID=A0A0N4WCC2_HAEPC|nr:unnamed protein product [Haemonchus placei]